jgi:hypothetical protein
MRDSIDKVDTVTTKDWYRVSFVGGADHGFPDVDLFIGKDVFQTTTHVAARDGHTGVFEFHSWINLEAGHLEMQWVENRRILSLGWSTVYGVDQ